MSRYTFAYDEDERCWWVFDNAWGKYDRSFPTLLEAENYATRGECPDEVDAS